MTKNPLLTVRCPHDILAAISKTMDTTGQNKTTVVVDMLRNSVPSLPIMERAKLPQVPAIYFVITPSNKLLYIGQTKNLFNRWLQHLWYQQFIEADPNSRVVWFSFDEDSNSSMPEIENEPIGLLSSNFNGTALPPNNNTPLLSFRCPKELQDCIEQKMGDTKTKTQTVIELLRTALPTPENPGIATPIRRELFDRFNSYCDEHKLSTTSAIEQILSQFFLGSNSIVADIAAAPLSTIPTLTSETVKNLIEEHKDAEEAVQPSNTNNFVTSSELDELVKKLRSSRSDLEQLQNNPNATFDTEQINAIVADKVTELENKLSLDLFEQLKNKSSQLDLQVKDAIAELEGKLEQKLDPAVAAKLLKLEAQLTNKIHAKLSKEWETIFSNAVAKTVQKTQGKSTKNTEQLEATTSPQSQPKPKTEVTTNSQRSEEIEVTEPKNLDSTTDKPTLINNQQVQPISKETLTQASKTNDLKNEQNSDKTLENKELPEWVNKLDFDKAYSDGDIAKKIGGNQSNVYRIRRGETQTPTKKIYKELKKFCESKSGAWYKRK